MTLQSEEHEPGNLGYCKKCGHSIWNREPCPNTMKAPQQQPEERRILSKIQKTRGCWNWTGSTSYGYGRARFKGKLPRAHRVVYEILVGPIPKGLQLDHLCRNRRCVNPSHLEPVTNRVNVLRGIGPTATHARQTHCIHGHKFDENNTIYGRGGKRRTCRTCRQVYERKLYYKKHHA